METGYKPNWIDPKVDLPYYGQPIMTVSIIRVYDEAGEIVHEERECHPSLDRYLDKFSAQNEINDRIHKLRCVSTVEYWAPAPEMPEGYKYKVWKGSRK